jgi:hypothetical protein
LASIKKLSLLSPDVKMLLGAHNVPVAQPTVLPAVDAAIHAILDGKVPPASLSGDQGHYKVGEISFRLRNPLPALKSSSGTN